MRKRSISRLRLACIVLVAILAQSLARPRKCVAEEKEFEFPLGLKIVGGVMLGVTAASVIHTGYCALSGCRAWLPARVFSGAVALAGITSGLFLTFDPDPGDSGAFGIGVTAASALVFASVLWSGGRESPKAGVAVTPQAGGALVQFAMTF